jgi:hypothetical protein
MHSPESGEIVPLKSTRVIGVIGTFGGPKGAAVGLVYFGIEMTVGWASL